MHDMSSQLKIATQAIVKNKIPARTLEEITEIYHEEGLETFGPTLEQTLFEISTTYAGKAFISLEKIGEIHDANKSNYISNTLILAKQLANQQKDNITPEVLVSNLIFAIYAIKKIKSKISNYHLPVSEILRLNFKLLGNYITLAYEKEKKPTETIRRFARLRYEIGKEITYLADTPKNNYYLVKAGMKYSFMLHRTDEKRDIIRELMPHLMKARNFECHEIRTFDISLLAHYVLMRYETEGEIEKKYINILGDMLSRGYKILKKMVDEKDFSEKHLGLAVHSLKHANEDFCRFLDLAKQNEGRRGYVKNLEKTKDRFAAEYHKFMTFVNANKLMMKGDQASFKDGPYEFL